MSRRARKPAGAGAADAPATPLPGRAFAPSANGHGRSSGWLQANPVLERHQGRRAHRHHPLPHRRRAQGAARQRARPARIRTSTTAVMLALATGARASNIRDADVGRRRPRGGWRLRFSRTKNDEPRFGPASSGRREAVLQAHFDRDPTQEGMGVQGRARRCAGGPQQAVARRARGRRGSSARSIAGSTICDTPRRATSR